MGKEQQYKQRLPRNRRMKLLVAVVILSLLLLLGIEMLAMTLNNRQQAQRTSVVLINQLENVLISNERKETTFRESLKENYISKAKAVSYILDHSPETKEDLSELIRIAYLMSIDEIHIFDESGTIIGGTIPIYYGYSFDSGEQMGYFKPMLADKALSMCQDVTPNTAEGKPMMYAICWNDAGDRMIQIGIRPLRLLEELRTNEISEVIAGMPAYDGIEILVADRDTRQIVGATIPQHIGQTLDGIGVDLNGAVTDGETIQRINAGGRPKYYVFKEYGDYILAVVQEVAHVNQDIPLILLSLGLYLAVSVVLIACLVRRMMLQLLNERKNAVTDQLTGLGNRRAYERELKRLERNPDREKLTYVVLDLNGLKAANDQRGHDAGDDLLVAATECIRDCFGKYGPVFRTGGDEFAALVHMDPGELAAAEEELRDRMRDWTDENGQTLSISWGYARAAEAPDQSLEELSKLADQRMYAAKKEYYRKSGMDRRRGFREEQDKPLPKDGEASSV